MPSQRTMWEKDGIEHKVVSEHGKESLYLKKPGVALLKVSPLANAYVIFQNDALLGSYTFRYAEHSYESALARARTIINGSG